MKERITGVALLTDAGQLWSLPAPAQHGQLFALAAMFNDSPEPCEQGFTTNEGRFVGRREARRIAEAAEQLDIDARHHDDLFSEDVR